MTMMVVVVVVVVMLQMFKDRSTCFEYHDDNKTLGVLPWKSDC